MSVGGSGTIPKVPQHQPDAVISQANPVSTTLYEVLPTTKNVRIISITPMITFAAGAPTPLEVVVTIDGQSIVFIKANPATATWYGASLVEQAAPTAQVLGAAEALSPYRAFMLEGRSVRVQARITWAVNQPTPLECRVVWAKW